jgi:preprotein translocase subunit SecG
VVLSLVVLVQNPKGGGLAGNIAGFSNQFMGVKQTTDVLEKGTWIFATVIALLCLTSAFFITDNNSAERDRLQNVNPAGVGGQRSPAAAPFTPAPGTTTADTNKR